MWLKRHIPYITVFFLLLIYSLSLFLFGFSNLEGIGDAAGSWTGTGRVEFASGSVSKKATDVTLVLQSGETALLDELTELQTADFSGSSNYAEIQSWADAHPQVSVRYTVSFPNGTAAANTAAALDLTGLRHEDVSSAVSLLAYLPNLSSIELGTTAQSSSPVNSEDLAAIRSACPGASVSYATEILGTRYELDADYVDLSGMTSAQVGDVAAGLSALPSLTRIKIAENATTDGSLAWSDLTAIAAACPNAAIDYNFTVCGVTATMADTSLDLSSMQSSDLDAVLAVLPGMSQLNYIELGSSSLAWSDVERLFAACPNATISYNTTVCGKAVNLADATLDLNHITMSDEGAAVKQILPYMRNLTTLDMDSCGVSDSAMEQIREMVPNCNVIWRIYFGSNYSVRTDVVKILASKPSVGGTLTNSNAASLKYCTKVRYLDLGHNDELSDFSFVTCMPELEVAVISMADISDLTPFASCPNLIYLEAGNTNISDLTPLQNCKNLRHLNIGTCPNITDISPLYDLDLLRLWLGIGDPVPDSQIEEMQSRHPDCTINTEAPTGFERNELGEVANEGYTMGWKTYYNYGTSDWAFYSANGYFPAQKPKGYFKVIYEIFEYGNGNAAYAFASNDPLLNVHGDDVEPINVTVHDTSFLFEPYDPDDPSEALPPS